VARRAVAGARPGIGRLVLAGLVLFALARPALAVSPVLWTLETFDDFEKGKPDGAAVAATGELVLAPTLRPLKVPPLEQASEPFLWSQVVDGKGTLYAGGGNGGKIYRVPKGAAGSLYYETGDLAVHALAVDKSDVLFAGTSPNGKIYRITGEARGEVYYEPEDRYIWALLVGPKGDLFAATGERGVIYRIPGKGKGEVFFDSEEFHVASLAFDPSGNLLAGTDGKGLLYRITPDGKASVLYDSRLREMNALAVDPKGVIYAAAIGQEGDLPVPPPQQQAGPPETPPSSLGPGRPPVVIPGVDSGTTTTVTVTASAAGPPAPAAGPQPRSEVYRIDPDGTVTTIWSSQNEVVYSLLVDPSGRPVVGTGDPGRIRVLMGAQQSTLLTRLPESQVTSLALGQGQQMFAASSNVGRLYVLDAAGSESGSYLSPTCDARTVARWGRISWRASVPSGGRVEVATRSGNSSVPDSTWSDWSAAYANPDGSAVVSPAARFLQWRARLARQGGGQGSGGQGPALQAVSVVYLQANLPPILKKITVEPPGVVRERLPFVAEPDPQDLAFTGIRVNPDTGAPDSRPQQIPEKRVYVRGMRAIDWEAEDPNGDALSFDLSFKGEGESSWKPLAKGLRDSYFAIDSTQLPDGLYRVRVEASDALSNPAGQAKTASLTGDPFLVDNTPPAVQVTARRNGKEAVIDASASDTPGPIARAEYSVDAARWVPIAPADGVSDSRTETYSISLGALRPGEHTVIVKVTDLLGNTGAGKAIFTSD
jgi:sugar lactone lactonase YvrE